MSCLENEGQIAFVERLADVLILNVSNVKLFNVKILNFSTILSNIFLVLWVSSVSS